MDRTKLTEALGDPVEFTLTAGQAADITPAEALVPGEGVAAVIAEKAYDADRFVARLNERAIQGSSRRGRIAPNRGTVTFISIRSARWSNAASTTSNTTGASSRTSRKRLAIT